MGLKIKSFQEVLTSMVDWVAINSTRLIDFSEGSVIRTFLEAIAAELEEYYFKAYKNIIWAMENSVYESFSFTLRDAIAAYGDVVLTFSNPLPSDTLVPKGTRFSTSISGLESVYFETQQDYNVLQGSVSATISVTATVAGVIGNVAENTITTLLNPVSMVSSVTNPGRFITGKDQETLAERKKRFNDFVDTRAKATVDSLAYGAKEIPQITGVYVDEQIGMVNVYCHDAQGNLSDDLKTQVENNLINYRAGGIPAFVLPISKTNLDVTVELTVTSVQNNYNFQVYVQNQIQAYFDNFVVSQDYLSSDLNAFVRNLDPMNIKNCKITVPVADFEVAPNELLRSGTITVTLVTA